MRVGETRRNGRKAGIPLRLTPQTAVFGHAHPVGAPSAPFSSIALLGPSPNQAAFSCSRRSSFHGNRAATHRLCASTAHETCTRLLSKPLASGIPPRNTFLRIPARPSVCARLCIALRNSPSFMQSASFLRFFGQIPLNSPASSIWQSIASLEKPRSPITPHRSPPRLA